MYKDNEGYELVVELRRKKANAAIFRKQKRLHHRLQSPASIHYSAHKRGIFFDEINGNRQGLSSNGSLYIYHFGEKIVNFHDKVKNNDLDKIKIMALALIFHYIIIHFIEILGFGCRGMYPDKKGI